MHIRPARTEDLEAVLNLVRELARFEKEPEAVTATLDDYQRDFADGVFECLVAEDGEGSIAGISLFFIAYSTWKGRMLYLDDLVVTEGRRGEGIGRALFDATLAAAKERGAKLVKWQVLDWNIPAQEFYKRIGAEIETGWWNGRLEIRDRPTDA